MKYKKLHKLLKKPPLPNGWKVIHPKSSERGGVYLLPTKLKSILELPNDESNSRLDKYSLLFEFHVTRDNYARIFARGRFEAEPDDYAKLDKNWKIWWDFARECDADKPKNTPPETRSVARWDDKGLKQIKFTTSASETAKIIRKYLEKPHDSLNKFIKKLARLNKKNSAL